MRGPVVATCSYVLCKLVTVTVVVTETVHQPLSNARLALHSCSWMLDVFQFLILPPGPVRAWGHIIQMKYEPSMHVARRLRNYEIRSFGRTPVIIPLKLKFPPREKREKKSKSRGPQEIHPLPPPFRQLIRTASKLKGHVLGCDISEIYPRRPPYPFQMMFR